MMNDPSCLLVLLNKNEEKGLEFLLPRLNLKMFSEVICIDGDSIDKSRDILKKFNIKVLSQKSSGRGEAFKIAFEYSRKVKFDYLLFFSTDGNEDQNDLINFIDLMRLNPDLIIASRMLSESINEEDKSLWRPRKWGNKFFSVLAWIFFSRIPSDYISDPINGYRALKFTAWNNQNFISSKFSIEYETSIRAYKNKFSILEFPTHELERIGGQSGAKAFKTSLDLTRIFVKELSYYFRKNI
jgi:glycosyltransferase involved in cell wall biosynthesis